MTGHGSTYPRYIVEEPGKLSNQSPFRIPPVEALHRERDILVAKPFGLAAR